MVPNWAKRLIYNKPFSSRSELVAIYSSLFIQAFYESSRHVPTFDIPDIMTNDQLLTVNDYSSQIIEDNKNVIQNDTPLMQKFELTKISPIEEMISKENEEVLNEDNISIKDSLPKMSYYPENNEMNYNGKNFSLKSDDQCFATTALPQRLAYNNICEYNMQHPSNTTNESVIFHQPSRTCSGGSIENREWSSEYNDENGYENFFTKGKSTSYFSHGRTQVPEVVRAKGLDEHLEENENGHLLYKQNNRRFSLPENMDPSSNLKNRFEPLNQSSVHTKQGDKLHQQVLQYGRAFGQPLGDLSNTLDGSSFDTRRISQHKTVSR